jgi:hypothetical protein
VFFLISAEIASTPNFRVQKPKFPFQKIDASGGVEKCLPRQQLKIPEGCPLQLRPTEKAGERLAVNVEAEARPPGSCCSPTSAADSAFEGSQKMKAILT